MKTLRRSRPRAPHTLASNSLGLAVFGLGLGDRARVRLRLGLGDPTTSAGLAFLWERFDAHNQKLLLGRGISRLILPLRFLTLVFGPLLSVYVVPGYCLL